MPSILNKSPTVSPAKHPHTITPPPPCFTVETRHVESIRSPLLRRTKTQWLEPKISNLDSSDQSTDFHWSNVHSLCSPPSITTTTNQLIYGVIVSKCNKSLAVHVHLANMDHAFIKVPHNLSFCQGIFYHIGNEITGPRVDTKGHYTLSIVFNLIIFNMKSE
ncbi:hypothetical protein AMECASPLE_037944 [Ameca splendens]|uniref:Uncharacterized protein n=1 Tax=Ameca splendens TaxID=208324 RepID=A0ABV0ZIM4_9TELE